MGRQVLHSVEEMTSDELKCLQPGKPHQCIILKAELLLLERMAIILHVVSDQIDEDSKYEF